MKYRHFVTNVKYHNAHVPGKLMHQIDALHDEHNHMRYMITCCTQFAKDIGIDHHPLLKGGQLWRGHGAPLYLSPRALGPMVTGPQCHLTPRHEAPIGHTLFILNYTYIIHTCPYMSIHHQCVTHTCPYIIMMGLNYRGPHDLFPLWTLVMNSCDVWHIVFAYLNMLVPAFPYGRNARHIDLDQI